MSNLNKRTFVYQFVFLLAIAALNFTLFIVECSPLDGLKLVGFFSVFELLLFYIFSALISGRFFTFSSLFLSVLFLFNFGQVVIFTFFSGFYSHVRFLLLLTPEDSFYGFKFIHLAFSSIMLGIILFSKNSFNSKFAKKEYFLSQEYDFSKIARDIIALTFPIKLVLDLLTLVVSIVYGGPYARSWLNSFPNVILYIGKISLIGFALLIICNKEKPSRQFRVFAFIEIYILIMMISGIRSENVGYLLVFLFLFLTSRKNKPRLFSVLIYSFFGILSLFFVVAVGNFRLESDRSITSFLNILSNAFTSENVLLSLLDNCGDTAYTSLCVICKWFPSHSPSYGSSYYLGWFSVLPNIPPIFTLPGDITRQSYFAIKLQESGSLSSSYTNIGGSLIGEQLFNFGLIGGAISSFAIGSLIGIISRKYNVFSKFKHYYGMIFLIPAMFALVYWVRDYFGGGFREAIWGPLFCLLIIAIFKRRKTHISSYLDQRTYR